MKFFEGEENNITPVNEGKLLADYIATIITGHNAEELKTIKQALTKFSDNTQPGKVCELNYATTIWLMLLCQYRMFALDKAQTYSEEEVKQFLKDIDDFESHLTVVNTYSRYFTIYYFPRFSWLIHLFRAQAYQRLGQFRNAIDHLEISTTYTVEYNADDKSRNLRIIRKNPLDNKNLFVTYERQSSITDLDDYYDISAASLMTRMLGQVEDILLYKLVNLLVFRAHRPEKFHIWSKRAKKNLGQDSTALFRTYLNNPNKLYSVLHNVITEEIPEFLTRLSLACLNNDHDALPDIIDDYTALLSEITCFYLFCKLNNKKESKLYQNALQLYIYAKSIHLILVTIADKTCPNQLYVLTKKLEFLTKNEVLSKFKIDAIPYAPFFVTLGCFIASIFSTYQNKSIESLEETANNYLEHLKRINPDSCCEKDKFLMFWLLKFTSASVFRWFKHKEKATAQYQAISITISADKYPIVSLMASLSHATLLDDETLINKYLSELKEQLPNLEREKDKHFIACVLITIDSALILKRLIDRKNPLYSKNAEELDASLVALLTPPVEVKANVALNNIKPKLKAKKKRQKKKKKLQKKNHQSTKKTTTKNELSSQETTASKKLNTCKKELQALFETTNKLVKEKNLTEANESLVSYQAKIAALVTIDHRDASSIQHMHTQHLERLKKKLSKLEHRQNNVVSDVSVEKESENHTGTEETEEIITDESPNDSEKAIDDGSDSEEKEEIITEELPNDSEKVNDKKPRQNNIKEDLKEAWSLLSTDPQSALKKYQLLEMTAPENLKLSVIYGKALAHEKLKEFDKAIAVCEVGLKSDLKPRMQKNLSSVIDRCKTAKPKNHTLKILAPVPLKTNHVINSFPEMIEGGILIPNKRITDFLNHLSTLTKSVFILNNGVTHKFFVDQLETNPSPHFKHYTIAVGLSIGQLFEKLGLQNAHYNGDYVRYVLSKGYVVDILPLIKTDDKRSLFLILQEHLFSQVNIACHGMVFDWNKRCYFSFQEAALSFEELPLKLFIPMGKSSIDLTTDQCWIQFIYLTRYYSLHLENEKIVKSKLITSLTTEDNLPLLPIYILELFCTGNAINAFKLCRKFGLFKLIFPYLSELSDEDIKSHIKKLDNLLSTDYGQHLFFESHVEIALSALLAIMIYPVMADEINSKTDLESTEFLDKLSELIGKHSCFNKEFNFADSIVNIWKESHTYGSVFIAASTWLKINLDTNTKTFELDYTN